MLMATTPSRAGILFKPGGFDNSVVDTVIAVNQETGEFSILITALQATGLVTILDSFGRFTVLAPTDIAFGELGITAENLVLDVRTLRAIPL
jgi:uncharacterized surface protein with fasciclin (FAS1) repeats